MVSCMVVPSPWFMGSMLTESPSNVSHGHRKLKTYNWDRQEKQSITMPPSTFLPERYFGWGRRRIDSVRLDATGSGVMKDFLMNRVALNFISRSGAGFLLVWICEFWGLNTNYTRFMPAETLAPIYDAAFSFVQCLFPLWNFLKHRMNCDLYITAHLLRSSEAFRHKHLKIKKKNYSPPTNIEPRCKWNFCLAENFRMH